MSGAKVPTSNTDLLKNLLGQRIVSVKRQLFIPDLEFGISEEAADGPIELEFNNGFLVHFEALTEQESVGIGRGKMSQYGENYRLKDLSRSSFWQPKMGVLISRIQVLQYRMVGCDNHGQFAIKIEFENNDSLYIEYVSDEDTLDTIRLSAHPKVEDYQIVAL